MDSIPDDCLVQVFGLLNWDDLCRVRLVCKRFLRIISDSDRLWQLHSISAVRLLSYCKDQNTLLKLLENTPEARTISWKSRSLFVRNWLKRHDAGMVRMAHHKMTNKNVSESTIRWVCSSDEKFQCLACMGTEVYQSGAEIGNWKKYYVTFTVEVQCRVCGIYSLYEWEEIDRFREDDWY